MQAKEKRCLVTGRDFSRAANTTELKRALLAGEKRSFVSGHDFSRAEKPAKQTWALAPEGRFS
jgi:enoyl-CoA hydratase/carnithine racemase